MKNSVAVGDRASAGIGTLSDGVVQAPHVAMPHSHGTILRNRPRLLTSWRGCRPDSENAATAYRPPSHASALVSPAPPMPGVDDPVTKPVNSNWIAAAQVPDFRHWRRCAECDENRGSDKKVTTKQ
jgi:hypothetical protein